MTVTSGGRPIHGARSPTDAYRRALVSLWGVLTTAFVATLASVHSVTGGSFADAYFGLYPAVQTVCGNTDLSNIDVEAARQAKMIAGVPPVHEGYVQFMVGVVQAEPVWFAVVFLTLTTALVRWYGPLRSWVSDLNGV